MVGGEGLGDGDEPDGGGIAPGPAGRARDAIANVSQPGAKRGGIDHAPAGCYFGSWAASALACAAFGPFGAELQVRLELRGRTREVAFVDERHAELIVRLGVVGLRGDRGLELLLRLGDLAGVPEDDALVVDARRRCRRAARSPAAALSSAAFALASAARSNFLWAL